MPRKYKCPIYMEHAAHLMRQWQETEPFSLMGAELEIALRQDQHDLYHDGEFADGCDICDKEREDYS